MSEQLSFAIDLAYKVGDLLLRHYRSTSKEIRIKEDHTLVTKADLEADEMILNSIKLAYPDDNWLSEESNASSNNDISDRKHAVWVIDPLDGTTNFSLGLEYWGVSLARLIDGSPDLGVVYFPLLDELYIGHKGFGAMKNNKALHIDPEEYSKMSFFTCCSRTFRRYQVDIPYKTRILGCASYTFCAVARGSAILGFEATPKIWDIAAAWLIVKEAGGEIRTLDGTYPFPLQSEIDYSTQSFPTLAAGSSERWMWGRQRIIPRNMI
jgi:myo-inositol-1(or 4)-monophosphatase